MKVVVLILSSTQVCVIPENKIHIPKSFTPNNDLCNDNFSVIGVGGFESSQLKYFLDGVVRKFSNLTRLN